MQKLSVILPTYNIEKYITQTLDSIINQTYKNLEIIIIDDCSKDSTAEILKEYAKQDSRIKLVFNKENIGPGRSRNLGIEKATGYYVTFMDHDDWQDLDRYENMIKILEEHGTYVCFSYANEFFEEIKEIKPLYYPKFNDSLLDLRINKNRDKIRYTFFPPWAKLYRLDFLRNNNLRFAVNDIKFDDMLFHSLLIYSIDRVSIYDKVSYTHRFFSKSISGKFLEDRVFMNKEYIENYKQALELAKTEQLRGKLTRYYFRYIKFKYLSSEQRKFLFSKSKLLYCKYALKSLFKKH